MEDQATGAGLVKRIADFLAAVPEIDRNHNGAKFGQCEVEGDVHVGITTQNADSVPLPSAEVQEAVGNAVGLGVQLGICECTVSEDCRGFMSKAGIPGVFLKNLSQ